MTPRPLHTLRDVTPDKPRKTTHTAVLAYEEFLRRFSGQEGTKEYRFIEGLLKPKAERAQKFAAKGRNPKGTITIRKLDEAFSIAIRMRDAATSGKCCTCSAFITFSNSDCGHYLGRQYYATRWNPMNARAQCKSCNRFNEGKKAEFRAFLVKRYGEKAIAEMEALHKRGRKPKAFEMEAIMQRIKGYTK